MLFEVAVILDFQMVEIFLKNISNLASYHKGTEINGEVHLSKCSHVHINSFDFGSQQGAHKTK